MHELKEYDIETKLIRDPIYTYIELPKIFLDVIDHHIFQRLRWVSQLPLEQLVYPSAQHSRFEHSLGAMCLAMKAAISLINNSYDKLEVAFNDDPEFSKIVGNKKNLKRKKQFILAAGLCGLLHDLGHAPFSHTLEDASRYSHKNIIYQHEIVTYYLVKRLLEKARLPLDPFVIKTLSVLNKKGKGDQDIFKTEILLRRLIDGPIDIDKGDYIIRDSYHCGVTYGIYDIQQLWRHIVITDEYNIGVDDKGALEAWSLRFARYKMFKNVYKHKTRNATDAMLIDIIADSLDEKDQSNLPDWFEIMPILDSTGKIHTDPQGEAFNYWTDDSLLKAMKKSTALDGKIERFLKRTLYKNVYELDLSPWPDAGTDPQFKIRLRQVQESLNKRDIEICFIINPKIIAPVFEEEIQQAIKVYFNDKEYTLAEYFDFQTQKNKPDEENVAPKEFILHIFSLKKDIASINEIKREIDNLLNEFKPD